VAAPCCPDHIAKLNYTRQVFQEGMRLYPPAPIIARAVNAPLHAGQPAGAAGIDGLCPDLCPATATRRSGTGLTISTRPFRAGTVKGRTRYAYLPFGGGARICIGSAFAMMEGVAILATLLRAVKLTSLADHPPKPRMRLTLRPDKKLMMRVERRKG